LAELQRLARQASERRRTGQFLIEGVVLAAEAIEAGLRLVEVWVEQDRASVAELQLAAKAEAAGAPLHPVKQGTLARVKASVTPPAVLVVAEIPAGCTPAAGVLTPEETEAHLPQLESGFTLVAVDMADPSNAGALLRCAEGAGAAEVVFAGNCVDSWSPKTVRASAGSVFRVRPKRKEDAAEHLRQELQLGRQVVATAAHRGEPYDEVDFTVPSTIVIGNETHGLADPLEKYISTWARIELSGKVESLNVAMAAAVICFEARRQLKAAPVLAHPKAD